MRSATIAFVAAMFSGSVSASEIIRPQCTILRDIASDEELMTGTCNVEVSPASTFKIALALMGFDSGVLRSPDDPSWSWTSEYVAPTRDQREVDPGSWMRDSVVWFSRRLVKEMGGDVFRTYVSKFSYGNEDTLGQPGLNDGLTHSWVSSSLSISPVEQAGFLTDLLAGKLPVSEGAREAAMSIMPSFSSGAWTVSGKTGSGWYRDRQGVIDQAAPFGWFVGWAEGEGRTLVFVRLVSSDGTGQQPLGLRVRDEFLQSFPELVASLLGEE